LVCWLLLLEEYGVKFEYLSGKKNMTVVADALSRLDMDILNIQKEVEEVLTLLSGSEYNSINIIKMIIPMHTALIFKEQAKVKDPGLREKGLAQPHYSINLLKVMIFSVTKITNKIYIPQSLRYVTKSTVLVP
jgi:hypothetical protein